MIDHHLRIARLWRAGKMIGGDEDDVRDALLGEVERLAELLQEAGRRAVVHDYQLFDWLIKQADETRTAHSG